MEFLQNPGRVAVVAFLIGLMLWFGGACLVLGSGPDPSGSPAPRPAGPTALPSRAVSPTRLPDRTSCNEIRGTEYRSEAERRWFLANCLATPSPVPTP